MKLEIGIFAARRIAAPSGSRDSTFASGANSGSRTIRPISESAALRERISESGGRSDTLIRSTPFGSSAPIRRTADEGVRWVTRSAASPFETTVTETVGAEAARRKPKSSRDARSFRAPPISTPTSASRLRSDSEK